jgi:flagellar motor switch protein FliG
MNALTPLGQISAPAGRAIPRLNRKQKAAIIVRLLLNEGAEVRLADLPEEMQATLTQQMGAMRHVDRHTLAAVVGEFAQELEAMGLTFPKGLIGALTALDGKISPQTAARLRKEAGVRQTGNPWDRIKGAPIELLVSVIEQESTEVAAVMLSKLEVTKAAELLGRLPGPKARRITYAVSQTGAVTPGAVDRIGLSLAAQLEDQPEKAFDDGPVERVGAILNFSPSVTRDDVLVGLDEEDKEFAELVRKAIFTFANIPARIETRDIPKVIRGVDQAVLVRALAAAMQAELDEAANYVLDNMSKRMAEQLREDMAGAGKIKQREGEEAMNAVIGAIRTLQADGEIQFKADEEEAEEDA